MYLKSIEMKGFKSFADKTDLEFKSGITAVVGPNGSGKSNISDAVRWVLGEQSVKQLRGGKMEDVIFAGTQYRKPIGQASVTLTLDNSCGTLDIPYNEVNVTRRLYRSGESEYLLNNTTVRLKDIHELFMDTGIGREGYSMIGQGKIDAILSGKADERRTLVEEAAGITKFKTRKEEGERKLKNAQENLDRVEDIISTYEERIGPLKKDKENAEKFIVFDKELKSLQITVLMNDLESLEGKNEGFISLREEASTAFNSLDLEFTKMNEKLSFLEEDLNITEDKRQKKREEYFIKKGDFESLLGDIRVLKENLRSLNQSKSFSENTKEESIKERENIVRQITLLEEKRKEAKESYDKALFDLNESTRKIENYRVEAINLENEVEELKDKNIKASEDIEKVKEKISKEESDREYLRGKIENLSSMNENYTSTLKLNEEGREKLTHEIKEIDKKKEDIKNSIALKIKESDELKNKREKYLEELESLRRIVKDAQNREGILRNLEESHEGYVRSVKDLFSFLKKKNSKFLESTKVVGDVVTTEGEYAQAIEAALGGYIGNVISETDKDASELIGILKKENFGKVTFLPRNVIRANRIPMPKLNGVKVLGFASDLVKTEEENREIINSILGRTLITDNLKTAMEVARQTGHKIKLVTLEGDIISAGGAMTGGSTKGGRSGVISRKAEIEELKNKIEEATISGKNLKIKEEEIKLTLEKSLDSLNKLKEEEINLSVEKERLEERLRGFIKELERVKDLLKSQDDNEDTLNEELEKTLDNLKVLNEEINRLKTSKDELLNELEEKRKTRNEKNDNLESLRNEVTEKRINESNLKNNLSNSILEIERSEDRKNNLDNKIKELELKTLEFKEEDLRINKEIESKEKEVSAFKEEIDVLNKESENLELEETKKKAVLKEEINKLSTLREERSRVEKQLIKANMSLEKYESDREDIIARLNEDLNLTVAEARDQVVEIESRSKARKRINELKGSITSLGNVNLSAIEEYEKVSEHYEYLTTQKNDLLKAKEELLSLIKDMTGKMRALFKENFIILSKNFKETFRQLFNGGTAELVLGEGDELTGNIDIIVQPPGKKLQNINLLSGGEKVLSAIALTFGILKMKPSPFCILDEIEAALDDANVYRYATFLKEFAKDTQFILITHRKGTMEAANVMYGVTMEEKGISKIVSVNLDESRTKEV